MSALAYESSKGVLTPVEGKEFLNKVVFAESAEKAHYGSASNIHCGLQGDFPGSPAPLRLRLPALQMRWAPKVWTSGADKQATSATMEVSFDLALKNAQAFDCLTFFQGLDGAAKKHLVKHRSKLFPGFEHLTDQQLAALYQPVTAPALGKDGDKKCSPRLRLRLRKAFSLDVQGGELWWNLGVLQKAVEEQPELFERRCVTTFVEIHGLTFRDGKVTLQVQLLVAKFLNPAAEKELLQNSTLLAAPKDVFGDGDIIVSTTQPDGEALQKAYGSFL